MSASRVTVETYGARWLRSPGLLLVVVPVAFILMIGVFRATEALIGWPETERERDVAMAVALVIAGIPLVQFAFSRAFPFLSKNRAQVEASTAWASVKLDFSQATAAVVAASRQVQVPENIIPPGMAGNIADSNSEEVVRAVQRATAPTVGTIDLGDGREWWTTRLLSLAAGAERFGSPEAIVFVATKGNVTGTFLGWAEPRPILDGLLRSYPDYAKEYYAALSIYEELLFSYQPRKADPASAAPAIPPVPLSPAAQQYSYAFDLNPEYSFMQILISRLQRFEPGWTPDVQETIWLTPALLDDRLGHVLYTQLLDFSEPVERQIDKILEAPGRYVAVARDGRFLGLARVDRAVRMLVKQLVRASEQSGDGTTPVRDAA